MPNKGRETRRMRSISPRMTFFLVVEGESEKIYLDRIRPLFHGISIVVETTKDKKAVDIVTDCVKKSKLKGLAKDDLKAVVFDSDTIDEDDMRSAVRMAAEKGIKIFTSNLCFEIWLIMHFEKPSRLYSEGNYIRRLTCLLDNRYVKSVGLRTAITLERVMDACDRSSRILPSGDAMDCHATENSSNMHVLVGIIKDADARKRVRSQIRPAYQ